LIVRGVRSVSSTPSFERFELQRALEGGGCLFLDPSDVHRGGEGSVEAEMDRRAELAAIEQFLSARQMSPCPAVYLAPSTAAVSAAGQARRLQRMELAKPQGLSAARNHRNQRKVAELCEKVAGFFAKARVDAVFTLKDVSCAVLGTDDLRDSDRRAVERAFRNSAPEGWHITIKGGRFLFAHLSNLHQ
jgi:hypothetical protein